VYTFFRSGKVSLNTSLGLGLTQYNSLRKTDYTNQLWTSEYESTIPGNQTFYLTETAKNLEEQQHITFLEIPVKLGIDYALSSKLSAYANIGLAYGVNLSSKYSTKANITRTGFYPDYNVTLFDVDVTGSPYYYPTNKAVTGSGSIDKQNNLSAEGALGMKYKLSSNVALFAGAKLMHGFQNVKTNPSEFIMATNATNLNTLANRADQLQTRAYGLELGVQLGLNCKTKTKNTTLAGTVTDDKTAAPLAATLLIKNNGATVNTVTTDNDGKYSITLPGGKLYEVETSATDYTAQSATVDLLKAGKTASKDFALAAIPQTVVLSGKVTDAFTAKPIKAKVVINSNGKAIKSADTNANGTYSIEVPKADAYELAASAATYISKTEKVEAKAKKVQKDVTLVAEIQGVQLETKVIDVKTGLPLKATMVVRNNNQVMQTGQTDDKGQIVTVVQEGKSYEVEVSANGYVPQRQTINLLNVARGTKRVILLDPIVKIEKGLVFKFKNVNFNTGTADLTLEALEVLNLVSGILIENPKLQIEISGHTDNDGKAPKNLALSKARAKSVVTYLTSKGAKPQQMKSLGFGQTKPIATNATPEGKAENRRVEFKVLGM
ncbi:MAG: carboxypeptidase regulatory-like domain-containing protein, partial [Paludibacter sp.]